MNSLPMCAIVGTALGFLAGLGVGGGSLLMLWLTLVLETPQATAQAMNLMFFIPSALVATLMRKEQGTLQLRPILPAMLAAVAASSLCTVLLQGTDTDLMRKLFGVLLLGTGLRELFYRDRKAK